MPTIKKPFEYFNVVTYTGNGASRTISGVGFQPDFVWIKSRSAVGGNRLFDSVRGATKALYSNLTNAEATESDSLTAFTSDGFSLGADTVGGGVNLNGVTYVAWCWKANGTGVTNTAGSITSTVSANTTSGFSVVTYTGAVAYPQTIGHGLGVAPKMIIIKDRSRAGTGWAVYHESLGNTKGILLNSTSASVTDNGFWNNTSPTSTVFTTGNGYGYYVNGTTDTYVAYCFSEVQGYSKFGSYTGNSSADGVFVYTGFRPRFIMIKKTSATENWYMLDTARAPYNVAGNDLMANLSNAEATTGGSYSTLFDILSNGFKARDGGSGSNGGDFIYMAFAENPLKYSLAR